MTQETKIGTQNAHLQILIDRIMGTHVPLGQFIEVSPKVAEVITRLRESCYSATSELQFNNAIVRAGLLQLLGRAETDIAKNTTKRQIVLKSLNVSSEQVEAVLNDAIRKNASLKELRDILGS